jgi:hypothetical protein
MQRGRWPLAWTKASLVIASLALGAPLAMAAVVGMGTLFPRLPQSGYLLYPRLGLCAPRLASQAEADADAPTVRRSAPPFRPTRTAAAVMPPALGQTLSRQWLGPRAALIGLLPTRANGE